MTSINKFFFYALFFISGVAGLGYEILWARMLSAGLGHEIVSVLAVVSAFFSGLALGAWGAVQATAAGVGMALSGVIRDLVNAANGATEGPWGFASAANGYIAVYLIEIALLVVTIAASVPLIRRLVARRSGGLNPDTALVLDVLPTGPQTGDNRGSSTS